MCLPVAFDVNPCILKNSRGDASLLILDLPSLDFFLSCSLDSNAIDQHVSFARPGALMMLFLLQVFRLLHFGQLRRVTLAYHNAHVWSDLVAAILVVQCCIAVIHCHALSLTERDFRVLHGQLLHLLADALPL